MGEQEWSAATFDGAAAAQARTIAALSPTERVVLLEGLLELAAATGALRRAREDKQRALDAMWSPG
ncbi:MAG: hypothetical protein ACT4P1_08255 [Sporichthyaceae bacterium]